MTSVVAGKKLSKFDPKTFLSTLNGGRKIEAFLKKQPIFVQGDPSDCVFYLQKGKIKLTVLSKSGKEATIGILNEGVSSEKVALLVSLSACAPQPQSPIAL